MIIKYLSPLVFRKWIVDSHFLGTFVLQIRVRGCLLCVKYLLIHWNHEIGAPQRFLESLRLQ